MASNPYGFFKPKSQTAIDNPGPTPQRTQTKTASDVSADADAEVEYTPLAEQHNTPAVYEVPERLQDSSGITTDGILYGNKATLDHCWNHQWRHDAASQAEGNRQLTSKKVLSSVTH
jgi:hypothetical protein